MHLVIYSCLIMLSIPLLYLVSSRHLFTSFHTGFTGLAGSLGALFLYESITAVRLAKVDGYISKVSYLPIVACAVFIEFVVIILSRL